MTDFGRRAGDMFKSTYDTDADGTVDDSEKLEASTKAQVQDHTPKSHTHTESEISDLDHDALKVKGVIINDAAKADQKVLAYDSATDRIVYIEQAPSGAVLNSIQRGTIEIGIGVTINTATIASVDTSKSICFCLGVRSTGIRADTWFCSVRLKEATVVEAYRGGTVGITHVHFQVVEFSTGIASSQRDDIYIAADQLSADFTISQVDPDKSILSNNSSRQGAEYGYEAATTIEMVDSTTLRATRGYIGEWAYAYFDLIEFD